MIIGHIAAGPRAPPCAEVRDVRRKSRLEAIELPTATQKASSQPRAPCTVSHGLVNDRSLRTNGVVQPVREVLTAVPGILAEVKGDSALVKEASPRGEASFAAGDPSVPIGEPRVPPSTGRCTAGTAPCCAGEERLIAGESWRTEHERIFTNAEGVFIASEFRFVLDEGGFPTNGASIPRGTGLLTVRTAWCAACALDSSVGAREASGLRPSSSSNHLRGRA
jgi:hypothetical protein